MGVVGALREAEGAGRDVWGVCVACAVLCSVYVCVWRVLCSLCTCVCMCVWCVCVCVRACVPTVGEQALSTGALQQEIAEDS